MRPLQKFTGQNITNGSRIFIHGQSAVPYRLVEEFISHLDGLSELEFVHIHIEGTPAHLLEKYRSRFRINNLFVGPHVRNLVDFDRVDYSPVFLSEIPSLFKTGRLPIDVALVHLSPPDRFGYCTLGVGVDITRAAMDSAKLIVAQINPQMPRTHGDTLIHESKIDYFIEENNPLPESKHQSTQSVEIEKIGQNVASLIENGSTLQMGIGAIPNEVLKSLRNHRNLGVHSEMFSDGVIELLEKGVIDNSKKTVHPGKVVASFIQGTQKVYDFVNGNPSVELYPSDYVNSPIVIARNPKVIAINSALEVDLTGQVCADSVGHRMVSGVGGQIDFIRGSALSPGV